jgi:hypothetical protein
LGNSLDNLVNLQKLTFGNEFNQYLNNSLDNLVNLQELTFGKNVRRVLSGERNHTKGFTFKYV